MKSLLLSFLLVCIAQADSSTNTLEARVWPPKTKLKRFIAGQGVTLTDNGTNVTISTFTPSSIVQTLPEPTFYRNHKLEDQFASKSQINHLWIAFTILAFICIVASLTFRIDMTTPYDKRWWTK